MSEKEINKLKRSCLKLKKHKDLGAIFFTSGTTGEPKLIQWTNEMLTLTTRRLAERHKIGSQSKLATLYEPSSRGGYSHCMQSILKGGEIYYLNKDMGYKNILKEIIDLKINILHTDPEHLYRLIKEMEKLGSPKIKTKVIIGGGVLSNYLIDSINEYFFLDFQNR